MRKTRSREAASLRSRLGSELRFRAVARREALASAGPAFALGGAGPCGLSSVGAIGGELFGRDAYRGVTGFSITVILRLADSGETIAATGAIGEAHVTKDEWEWLSGNRGSHGLVGEQFGVRGVDWGGWL